MKPLFWPCLTNKLFPRQTVTTVESEVNQAPTTTPANVDKPSNVDGVTTSNGAVALEEDVSSTEGTLKGSDDGNNAGDKRDHDAMTADEEEKPAENPEKKQKADEQEGDEEKYQENQEKEEDKKDSTSDVSGQNEKQVKKKGPGGPKRAEGATGTKAKKGKKVPTPRSAYGIASRTRSRAKA